MPCLVAHNLSFAYHYQPILQDITLQAEAGQITVLMGPSGVGKSTLLWLLAGLLCPTSGRTGLAINGQSLHPLDPRHDTVGMVFQHLALWDHLTVQQHLEIILSSAPPPRRSAASASMNCLPACTWTTCACVVPPSFPAASDSASPSPVPWWPNQAGSCSMSPWLTWTVLRAVSLWRGWRRGRVCRA